MHDQHAALQGATGGIRQGKRIKEDARAQELEPVSLSAQIHQHVRIAIETAVHEELRARDEALRAP